MKKDDFEQALRRLLMSVPLEERKKWDEFDLLTWWTKAQKDDSYLTWERCSGDIWQHVKVVCRDLIGQSAIW